MDWDKNIITSQLQKLWIRWYEQTSMYKSLLKENKKYDDMKALCDELGMDYEMMLNKMKSERYNIDTYLHMLRIIQSETQRAFARIKLEELKSIIEQ